MVVTALAQRAEAVRYQNRLAEAETLCGEAISHADRAHMAKVAADLAYNRALILQEADRIADAGMTMRDALGRYQAIGDRLSIRDAQERLQAWLGDQ